MLFLFLIIAASKYRRCTVHGLGGWGAGNTSNERGEWEAMIGGARGGGRGRIRDDSEVRDGWAGGGSG